MVLKVAIFSDKVGDAAAAALRHFSALIGCGSSHVAAARRDICQAGYPVLVADSVVANLGTMVGLGGLFIIL